MPMTTDHKRFHRPAHLTSEAGRTKRKRKRLRRIPSLWARLAALTLVVVALVVLMISLTVKAIRPYRQASVEAKSLGETRQRIADLQSSNAMLYRRIAYLKTPEGIASEAHPLGWVHPGETLLVMPGFPAANLEETTPSGEFSQAAMPAYPHPLLSRFWDHLRDL